MIIHGLHEIGPVEKREEEKLVGAVKVSIQQDFQLNGSRRLQNRIWLRETLQASTLARYTRLRRWLRPTSCLLGYYEREGQRKLQRVLHPHLSRSAVVTGPVVPRPRRMIGHSPNTVQVQPLTVLADAGPFITLNLPRSQHAPWHLWGTLNKRENPPNIEKRSH